MARVNRQAAAQAIELLDVRANDKVLEVGSGPGVGVQLLLECVIGGWVAGVDQSQEMVGQAAARNAAALRERTVDLRYGSVERLPFTEDAFDKALAINSCKCTRCPCRLQEIRAFSNQVTPLPSASLPTPVNQRMGLRRSLAKAGFAHARIVDQAKQFCAIATKP